MPVTSQNLDILFEAVGNKHRREMIYALSLQPHSISQLASKQALSLPAIHKHVTVLEQANLIHRKKVGQTNFLSLNRTSLLSLQEWVMQYHPYWGDDHETLENYTQYVQKNDPSTLKLRRGKKGGEEK